MIKLWGKCIKNKKIVRQKTMAINVDKMDWSKFYDYISELSHNLDSPTPLIIKSHIFNFAKFNFVKFTKSDFVESLDYDELVVELIKD